MLFRSLFQVRVDIGMKSDAIIPISEFRYNPDLKEGDEVEVYIETLEDKNGQLRLSHKKACQTRSWDRVNQALQNDEIIKGYVKSRTKGGMIVDIFGIEAFLPGSQIDVRPIRDYDVYLDKTMEFKVVKINQEYKNVVVSHKALIEAELEAQKREIISKLEKGQVLEGKVIFSYEESYGYMLGDYVRDKDAVTASMLLTEMAAWYDAQGMTLFDALNALYEKYGWYAEKTHNLVMPGLDGLRDMAKLMKDLRENPPTEISGVKVIVRKDYTDGSVIDCVTGAKSRMELSGSNVLRYELADGTVILVRPSGTEPKIKVYILTQGADAAAANANLEKYGRWVAALKP